MYVCVYMYIYIYIKRRGERAVLVMTELNNMCRRLSQDGGEDDRAGGSSPVAQLGPGSGM